MREWINSEADIYPPKVFKFKTKREFYYLYLSLSLLLSVCLSVSVCYITWNEIGLRIKLIGLEMINIVTRD